jgi:integrase
MPAGDRVQVKLGQADDVSGADGQKILTCEQAKEAARSWAKSIRSGAPVSTGLTVNDALDQYFEAKTAEGMKAVYDAKSRANLHIRPALGSTLVAELTADRLRRWRDAMVKKPKHLRTGRFAKKQNTREVDLHDAEALRRRRDTANRTLTVLKAAMNWAYSHQLVGDDKAWRLVKPFRATTAARVRFLETKEQQRLLNTAEGALRDLIAAALMTGARFSEIARLTVRDFDRGNGSVFIAESKSGKARHVPLTARGVTLFERLAAGKLPTAPLLTQESGEKWKPATYQRSFKDTLERAKIENLTLHELRHSYASTMVRAGAPLIVVAEALGHADTRMVSKHYAHLAPSYVADTIRRTAPDLTLPNHDRIVGFVVS